MTCPKKHTPLSAILLSRRMTGACITHKMRFKAKFSTRWSPRSAPSLRRVVTSCEDRSAAYWRYPDEGSVILRQMTPTTMRRKPKKLKGKRLARAVQSHKAKVRKALRTGRAN